MEKIRRVDDALSATEPGNSPFDLRQNTTTSVYVANPLTRGTVCEKSARTGLWEPREGNLPWRPGRLYPFAASRQEFSKSDAFAVFDVKP